MPSALKLLAALLLPLAAAPVHAQDWAKARLDASPRHHEYVPLKHGDRTVQAFVEAPIYARTNGYLKSWSTDIGSAVRKGQLLAEIDTPEVDQQLAQAIADLATARANEALSNTTNARWKELLATESVSKQARAWA